MGMNLSIRMLYLGGGFLAARMLSFLNRSAGCALKYKRIQKKIKRGKQTYFTNTYPIGILTPTKAIINVNMK